jgi:hypothetical protein
LTVGSACAWRVRNQRVMDMNASQVGAPTLQLAVTACTAAPWETAFVARGAV